MSPTAARWILATATAVATLTATSGHAMASPPSGAVTEIAHHARALVDDDASVHTPAGTQAAVGTYTLAPSGGSGWRAMPATALLAVTAGALTVTISPGCGTRQVRAGEAIVLERGRALLTNSGGGEAALTAVFIGGPRNTGDPLVNGSPAAAPDGCAAGPGTGGAASTHAVQGTLVPAAAYGSSAHADGVRAVPVEGGMDVVVSSYTLAPGFSSGWAAHTPTVIVVSRGALTYYEAHHGSCAQSGRFGAGQAFVHTQRHAHLAANEGTEPVTATFVVFNVPHGGTSAVPYAGNVVDTIDFTPLPPAGCPRIR